MKRRITALLTALLLALTLCVPALAVTEYGAYYDETDQLGSVELTYQGEKMLPQLTQELGVDLRVDAFTEEDVSEDTSVEDIAAYVYENSGDEMKRDQFPKTRCFADAAAAQHGGRRVHARGEGLVRIRLSR